MTVIPIDDGPALAKDDQSSDSRTNINDNAKLIDKIQNLQQEVQELTWSVRNTGT